MKPFPIMSIKRLQHISLRDKDWRSTGKRRCLARTHLRRLAGVKALVDTREAWVLIDIVDTCGEECKLDQWAMGMWVVGRELPGRKNLVEIWHWIRGGGVQPVPAHTFRFWFSVCAASLVLSAKACIYMRWWSPATFLFSLSNLAFFDHCTSWFLPFPSTHCCGIGSSILWMDAWRGDEWMGLWFIGSIPDLDLIWFSNFLFPNYELTISRFHDYTTTRLQNYTGLQLHDSTTTWPYDFTKLIIFRMRCFSWMGLFAE